MNLWSRLNDKIADVKKQFKDMTGHALKVSELSNRDDLEMIQATSTFSQENCIL